MELPPAGGHNVLAGCLQGGEVCLPAAAKRWGQRSGDASPHPVWTGETLQFCLEKRSPGHSRTRFSPADTRVDSEPLGFLEPES